MAQALRQAGYRLTKPRLAVLRVLSENDESLSPHQIHRLGRATYPRLGLVTVYRTLEILDELGIARRVHSQGHCQSYARAQGHRHYLICRRCGRVIEFPCEGLSALIQDLRHKTEYVIEEHLLELTGLCPECQGEV